MRVEYKQTPPQVLVARMNRFIQESQVPGWTVQLRWVRLEDDEPDTGDDDDPQLGQGTGRHKHSECCRISNTSFSRYVSESSKGLQGVPHLSCAAWQE